MNKQELIEKVLMAGYTSATIEEHVFPAKNNAPPTRTELWLIAEPHSLLDPKKKNFALIKILTDAGVSCSEITTYSTSIIARNISFVDSSTGNGAPGRKA